MQNKSVQPEIQSRFNIARSAALSAGITAHRHFRALDSLTIEAKGFQDVVSNADREVEMEVRALLDSAFPEDGIIGEEYDNKPSQSGYTWVIDPIDGTANFVTGTPCWAVVIACVKDDETVLGVIRDPVAEETWAAIKDHGATLNERSITVANAHSLEDGSTGVGLSNRVPRQLVTNSLISLIDAGGIFYRNASGALMIAYVADGRLIGYCEPHMNAWDCLAAMLIVSESGGIVQAFDMQEMLSNGTQVVVAAPGVYQQLVDLTDKAYA